MGRGLWGEREGGIGLWDDSKGQRDHKVGDELPLRHGEYENVNKIYKIIN